VLHEMGKNPPPLEFANLVAIRVNRSIAKPTLRLSRLKIQALFL